MLSKIEFFESATEQPDFPAERERLLPVLCRQLQTIGRDAFVTPALGGTLGICFQAEISGEARFLKTHLAGAKPRERLAKEADILIRLYGDAIVLDRFDVRLADGTARLCLLMPVLMPLAEPMQPEDAVSMAQTWRREFKGNQPESLVSLEKYLKSARHALATLSDRAFLTKSIASDLRRLIARLEDRLPDLPPALCHGDFGPKNIMVSGARPVAIDWEDAFWGIAGYDYLYWLTFMENRPLLRNAAFGRTELTPVMERAILGLVVLLKSYLAVCSGAHRNHAVSIQARVTEIFDLQD